MVNDVWFLLKGMLSATLVSSVRCLTVQIFWMEENGIENTVFYLSKRTIDSWKTLSRYQYGENSRTNRKTTIRSIATLDNGRHFRCESNLWNWSIVFMYYLYGRGQWNDVKCTYSNAGKRHVVFVGIEDIDSCRRFSRLKKKSINGLILVDMIPIRWDSNASKIIAYDFN